MSVKFDCDVVIYRGNTHTWDNATKKVAARRIPCRVVLLPILILWTELLLAFVHKFA